MSRKIWLVALAALFLPGSAFAADVSGIATNTRYDLNATAGIKSIPANEIRRIPDMIKEPKAQVGMWVPMVEPEPVVRTMNNTLASNTRIFKNTGAMADQFPYLVKVVSSRPGKSDETGWFVYKNVKYNWRFEDAGDGSANEDGKEKASGGKNGSSGGAVWTPFYKASAAEKAVDYMKAFVTGNGEPVWDPKVYPNSHTKPYDSGISGTADTAGSTVLQEVGMLMTYEVAKATVNGETGPGYVGNADPEMIEPSMMSEAKLVSVDAFTAKEYRNPKPDGWKGEELTAYNRVYVEDYTPPNVRETKVKIYGGNAGTAVDRVYEDGQWKEVNGIKYEYEDDNPNAAASSDRLQASMNYTCGNMDLYRLDNPHYNPDDPNSDPFVYFTYLHPVTKNGKTYGPYVGVAKKAEEAYYYKNLDPNWKNKPAQVIEEYVKNRYAHAYMGRSLPAEYRGLVYYIIDERQSGLLKIKMLNGNSGNSAAEIDSLISEYKTAGAKGAAAAADLEAFKAYHSSHPTGDLYRYAYIEFKDGGRYCVGPINFEKGNYTEKVVGAGADAVKQGTWYVDNARILLPKHFALNSREWNNGDANAKIDSDVSEAAKGYKLNADGTWVKPTNVSEATAEDKAAAAAMPKNAAEAHKRYGEGWMQKVPDLFYKVDAADCCGNNTNQIGFIKVFDDGVGSKPLTEVTISDSRNQNDHTVFVPNDESLESGQKIEIKNPDGSSQAFDGGKYDGDYDMTKKDISVKDSGSGTDVAPIAKSLQLADKDKTIYEDVRLNISANAYDNIDRFMKYQGISKVTFKIAELDQNGNPTGKYEDLENDKNDSSMKWDESTKSLVKENDGTDNWTPAMKFYHIFRNPGNYKVEYTAADMPIGGKANTQYMAFKVVVRNQTQDVRTIDTDQNRK